MRWGDADEDETIASLPAPSVQQHGNIKTVVEYRKTDKGDIVKHTTKYKVVTVEKKVYKVSYAERERSSPWTERRRRTWGALRVG